MIIYGKNPVLEAVKLGIVKDVFIRKGSTFYNIDFHAPVHILHKNEFDSRFHKDAQGLAAEIDDIATASLADVMQELREAKGVVLLDRVQDPHNFGAIVRSAHVFGINHIVIPRYNSAPISATVVKASAGALLHSKIIQETNLREVLEALKKINFQIVSTDMDGEYTLKTAAFSDKVALVVGSEGRGIRQSLVEVSDLTVRIPMSGMIDSLNAAQIAAIAFYEIFGER